MADHPILDSLTPNGILSLSVARESARQQIKNLKGIIDHIDATLKDNANNDGLVIVNGKPLWQLRNNPQARVSVPMLAEKYPDIAQECRVTVDRWTLVRLDHPDAPLSES